MVPMPPSRIMMRSARPFWIRATRSGWSQGRLLMGMLRSGLAREKADDFEMRRAAFTAQALATDHVETGFPRHARKGVTGETEVAVVERLDDGTVVVLAEGGNQQAAATFQHAGHFVEDLLWLLRMSEGVQQKDKIELALAEVQRVHVARADVDVGESREALAGGIDHALGAVDADDGVRMRRQQLRGDAVAGSDVQDVAGGQQL